MLEAYGPYFEVCFVCLYALVVAGCRSCGLILPGWCTAAAAGMAALPSLPPVAV